MIVPGSIPVIEGDMEALGAHARSLSETGQAFADTGAAVHTTWQGLHPHYVAPESGQLLSATGPVATASASVGEDLGTAGTALATYATEVTVIQAQFVALRRQADEFVATVTAIGDGWNSDQTLVDRDTHLNEAVNTQIVAFQEAERRCASALRALYGAPPLTADNGDGVLDLATEHGYTLDQLNAAAANGGLPWGTITEVDHPWYVDVVNVPLSFAAGLLDSGTAAVVGIGALVGIDETGWHGSTAGEAWGNVGNLGMGLVIYGVFGIAEAERIDHDGPIPWLPPGTLGATLEAAGKGFIAYDQWDDDPARAAGATVGNIVLAVVGTKGAGATLRASGSAVGRIPGPVAAHASRALLATGNAIGRLPTLADIARGASNAFQGFRTRLFGEADAPSIDGRPDGAGRAPTDPDAPSPDPIDPPAVREPDGAPDRSPDDVETPPTLREDIDTPAQRDGEDDLTAEGSSPIGGDEATPTNLEGAAASEQGDGVRTRSDAATGDPLREQPVPAPRAADSMPAVAPGDRTLGLLSYDRVVRGGDGLVTTIDGVPTAQYLENVARERAEQFRDERGPDTYVRKDIGRVTSAAVDTRSGAVVEAMNGPDTALIPVDRLHPVLAERVASAEAGPGLPNVNRDGSVDPGVRPYPAPWDPLNHAEVKAVNELLWRRGVDAPVSTLSEIRVDNYFPFGGTGVRQAPCCANCAILLAGVPSNAGRFTGFPPGPHNFIPE